MHTSVWYRKDLFEEKGLEIPTTWEAFKETAVALNDGDEMAGFPVPLDGVQVAAQTLYELMCSKGVYFLSPETGEYIFDHHPRFRNVKEYYDRYDPYHIEGGDILNLSKEVIAVGISQRTEANAIEFLAKHIFRDEKSPLRKILVFSIPKNRSLFMNGIP